MAKMKAAMAAVLVMEKEGVTQAFGVPGAAINPLYAALREMDHAGVALIAVEALPETAEWAAVADRLRRAVTGSGGA